jgi:hypothetical protein
MRVGPGRDWVAVILAVGLVTAMNCFTFAVLWDAFHSDESGLSENATQVLTGWGGGIIGILGVVFGMRNGQVDPESPETDPDA